MSVFTNPASSDPAQAREYTAAVLGLLGDRDAIGVLQHTEGELRKYLSDVPADQLTRPEAPGKWSIRHVMQHLADSELVWGYRLRMVLAHDRPPITGYDQDLFAERLGYEMVEAKQAVEDFGWLRKANLRILTRASAKDLERVGVHSERGEESLGHLIRLYAGHDLLHLRQIERIRAGRGRR